MFLLKKTPLTIRFDNVAFGKWYAKSSIWSAVGWRPAAYKQTETRWSTANPFDTCTWLQWSSRETCDAYFYGIHWFRHDILQYTEIFATKCGHLAFSILSTETASSSGDLESLRGRQYFDIFLSFLVHIWFQQWVKYHPLYAPERIEHVVLPKRKRGLVKNSRRIYC